MDRRGQLAWAQRNRSRATCAVPLGEAARAWANGLNLGKTGILGRINVELCSVVDEMFYRCCVVCGIKRGMLVIGVEDASLVGWMTRAWRTRLIRVLAEAGMGVVDVRFEYRRAALTVTGGERE